MTIQTHEFNAHPRHPLACVQCGKAPGHWSHAPESAPTKRGIDESDAVRILIARSEAADTGRKPTYTELFGYGPGAVPIRAPRPQRQS